MPEQTHESGSGSTTAITLDERSTSEGRRPASLEAASSPTDEVPMSAVRDASLVPVWSTAT